MKDFHYRSFGIYVICFSIFIFFLSAGRLNSAEVRPNNSFEDSLKLLESSYPKEDSADPTVKPLFYLYSSDQNLSEEAIERQKSYFENGLDGVDISNTCWRGTETFEYRKPKGNEVTGIRGYPVLKEEFVKTYNCKYKRLFNVNIELLALGNLDFEDWILKEVSIRQCCVSHCLFKNATLIKCKFEGIETHTDPGALRAFPYYHLLAITLSKESNADFNKTFQLSFEQFSSTRNYRDNDFLDTELSKMDLSDWDFTNKNLSSLKLISCVCSRKNDSSAIFDQVEFSDSEYRTLHEKMIDDYSPLNKSIRFPLIATEEMLGNTRNYNARNCQFMSFRNPSVNLASQNLSFGSIIVSKFVEISNSLINNARIRTIGLDFSNQTDVIILNNKLYSTKSHKTGDLRGVQFYVPIIDCDLTNQNLSGAAFYASVKNTRFDNAIITDCNFYFAKDLTLSQIKSTWNYKNGRMDDAILPERFRNEIESETFYKTKSFQEKKLQQEEFGVSAFRRAPELELPKCYNRLGRTYASMYDNWRDFLLDLEQIKNSVGKKYYLPYACIDSWDLRGMDLSDAIIAASSMKGTNFTNANIDGACFQEKYDKAPLDSDDNLETFGLFLPNPFDEEIYNKEKRGFRGLFTKEQLESTASYKNRRLANMTFTQMCDIRGVDLSGFDLSNTLFITSLAEVNLTDAVITNCVFGGFASKVHKGKYVGSRDYVYPQLTAEQIKSTWNYKHHKMEGIALPEYLRKELGLPSEGDEDSSSRDLDSND